MSKNYPSRVTSTVVRSLYAPGCASLTASYFNTHLSLRFYLHIGYDNIGRSRYDLKNGITTTMYYEGAAYLYQAGMLILGGINPEKEIEAVLQCNKAVLILEYKHDQDNQMAVFLIVEKNDQSITFRFPARKVQVKENGQTITKVIQSGLSAFVMTIEGYLTGIGADLHLSKLHDDFESSQDEDQQAYDTTVNYGYEQENYGSYGSL